MFDMGFIKDIRYILRRLPPYHARQSFLFSATLGYREMELAYEFMNNPVKVSATPEQLTVAQVEEILYHVAREEKLPLLLFFQAEDGIRDATVTGVQTCALPILITTNFGLFLLFPMESTSSDGI